MAANQKQKRTGKPSAAQATLARTYWATVTRNRALIAEWTGLTKAAVDSLAVNDRWGYREWREDEKAEHERFKDGLKAQQDAINRESFEASLFYLRFHRKAAERVESDADAVAMAADRSEDSLLSRLKAAPPLAQVVQSGRLVTGQNTEKTEAAVEVANNFRRRFWKDNPDDVVETEGAAATDASVERGDGTQAEPVADPR